MKDTAFAVAKALGDKESQHPDVAQAQTHKPAPVRPASMKQRPAVVTAPDGTKSLMAR